MSVAVEIAVQDVAGAVVARDGGADRVELCTALGATGGLTPSVGLLNAVCAVGIGVHALIRTRPGGFVYSEAEVDVLVADVRAAVRAGASGVVVGALRSDGSLDVEAMTRLVSAAREAESSGRAVDITFHRALDAVADPVATIGELGKLGVDRVLTSGGASRAGDGLAVLAALVGAESGVTVMAGGGVDLASVPALLAAGVDAIHLSAKANIPDPGNTGPGGGTANTLEVTDAATVAGIVAAVKRAS
ncbi:MAG: copper homeostasis protein CutC [Gordonia sp. (in: high G+C Gram-positive bacteria)]|uniref:copper homeostasis protein CutC n=1 Tax=Gordonia sp. (in: high G+C Gram-positive bacteria) TaxID=84139 RepID=UPI003C783761